jgi:hypothetical protein
MVCLLSMMDVSKLYSLVLVIVMQQKSLDNLPLTLLFYRPALLRPHDAEVAQLVEQRPEKPRVRSSILRLGTIVSLLFITATAEISLFTPVEKHLVSHIRLRPFLFNCGSMFALFLIKQPQLKHLFAREWNRILTIEAGRAVVHSLRYDLLDSFHTDIAKRVCRYVFSDFLDTVR